MQLLSKQGMYGENICLSFLIFILSLSLCDNVVLLFLVEGMKQGLDETGSNCLNAGMKNFPHSVANILPGP